MEITGGTTTKTNARVSHIVGTFVIDAAGAYLNGAPSANKRLMVCASRPSICLSDGCDTNFWTTSLDTSSFCSVLKVPELIR